MSCQKKKKSDTSCDPFFFFEGNTSCDLFFFFFERNTSCDLVTYSHVHFIAKPPSNIITPLVLQA